MKCRPDALAAALYLSAKVLPDAEASVLVGRFVAFVRRRWGPEALGRVLKLLPAVANRVDGIPEILISSARTLPPETVQGLLTAFGLKPGEAEVTTRVQSELIGGIRIKRGDSVFDATVSRRIERLRQLTGAIGRDRL